VKTCIEGKQGSLNHLEVRCSGAEVGRAEFAGLDMFSRRAQATLEGEEAGVEDLGRPRRAPRGLGSRLEFQVPALPRELPLVGATLEPGGRVQARCRRSALVAGQHTGRQTLLSLVHPGGRATAVTVGGSIDQQSRQSGARCAAMSGQSCPVGRFVGDLARSSSNCLLPRRLELARVVAPRPQGSEAREFQAGPLPHQPRVAPARGPPEKSATDCLLPGCRAASVSA
jgi:hypothetical protein